MIFNVAGVLYPTMTLPMMLPNDTKAIFRGREAELRTAKGAAKPLVYPSTGNLSSQFFFWEGLISICSYSFWRRPNYFLSSLTVAVLDPGEIMIFFDIQFFPAVQRTESFLNPTELII